MQATSVVEIGSSKGNLSNGKNLQKYEPSNSKKENLFSSNHCNETRINLLGEWNPLAPKRSANNQKINRIDKTDLLEPSFTMDPDTNTRSTHSQSDEFEDSIDYAFLNETYSIVYSESELKNESVTHLNSEIESEMQKKEEIVLDILEPQGNKTFGLENISNDFKEIAEDVQNIDIDEDSQQEYHSAEEQEYISNQLSFDQAETLNVANLKVVELQNAGHAIKCTSNPEDKHKSESSSIISLDSIDVSEQKYLSPVSTLQNSVMLREYHDSEHENGKEEETGLMYHTIFDEFLLKCSPLEKQVAQSQNDFLKPEKTLKTKIYTGKTKNQKVEIRGFCENASVPNKILQHIENPGTLAQDKALETLLQPYKDCQTSCTTFDDSQILAYGHSHSKSLQNNANQILDCSATPSEFSVKDNESVEDNRIRVVDGNTTKKAYFHNMKGECPESMTNAKRDILTVNQMVDVSTDFRACFTTSTATNTRSSVVSTSSNTEITMMNKEQPNKWPSEMQSVACNTDWSYNQDNENSQMLTSNESLGKSLSVDSLKPNGNFLKSSLELRKACDHTDFKKHPKGEFELAKEMEKDLPSNCCQKIIQRAMKAELHLLHIHYQMCHRHCSDIYQLVMENREVLNRHLLSDSTKKELGAVLLSVLGDLKIRYMNLKEKIKEGIPLEEMPPLSIETKLLAAFSCFAFRLMKEDSYIFLGADCELDHQSTSDVDISSSLKNTVSQMSVVSDNSNAIQNRLPKDDFKNGEIDVDLSQLKLEDKGCKNDRGLTEDWFDARENLTGTDFSEIQENQIEQDKGHLELTQEMKNIEPLRRDKGYLIHVGSLCPSVSEADLRAYFQKYQVCEISIDDSSNYRYASLTFKKSNDAKTAVKEMNGIKINGKAVNVRLVKTPGEYPSPLLLKNGNRVSVNNLENSTCKESKPVSSISRLARTRPRHLVSEQDNELFPFEQKKGLKKNCKQLESAKLLPDVPIPFIPPNTLNLRSFTKIINRLAELHPETERDHIIDALQEVRINHKGFLNGLSINTIVEMTASVLKKSPSS
ncbi:RNA-binding protein 44 [Suncus etruscus]|uniref:RNA-binding protein 44 n=1 Tax=Suncus etruscus TaxID=109475 RepID=UPI00211016C2|nr:RNA-binding protein 44 [Suncus etruscus]